MGLRTVTGIQLCLHLGVDGECVVLHVIHDLTHEIAGDEAGVLVGHILLPVKIVEERYRILIHFL